MTQTMVVSLMCFDHPKMLAAVGSATTPIAARMRMVASSEETVRPYSKLFRISTLTAEAAIKARAEPVQSCTRQPKGLSFMCDFLRRDFHKPGCVSHHAPGAL